ncbi:MAG TPA: hypothetical protein VGQ42_08860 [Candidatus Dormibacteraeota bacterium]|jgi:drug/metabolite transporter (DMT)-like permease|nr:hypothetical protein [Candidatus Dormibacteraeota bacterium]
MSRSNRRKQNQDGTPQDGAAPQDSRPQAPREPVVRWSFLRRSTEEVPVEPGYTNPAPWSVRGTLTASLIMAVLNAPVSALVYQFDKAPSSTFASTLVFPSPLLFFLYALVAMPFARRLAQERRPMRTLETLSLAALMYILLVVSISIAVQLSGHNADANDGKQMLGIGVAALLGSATGAALYPVLYRKLYMHRLPSARGGPRRGPRP